MENGNFCLFCKHTIERVEGYDYQGIFTCINCGCKYFVIEIQHILKYLYDISNEAKVKAYELEIKILDPYDRFFEWSEDYSLVFVKIP